MLWPLSNACPHLLFHPESPSMQWQGLLLNPQGDLWAIWELNSTGQATDKIRIIETKSVPSFEIVNYQDIVVLGFSKHYPNGKP
jgi:hypothetical protein